MISRRTFTISLSSFFVNTDRSPDKIAREIEALGKDHNKVYDQFIKRARHIAPAGDAVACGWMRRLGEINHKIGDLFVELAEALGGK